MKNKEMIIDIFFYFCGSIVVSILGFVLSILYSNMFNPDDYGIYSLVYSLYNLIVQVYSGWIALSLIRNYEIYKINNKERKLCGTLFVMQLLLSFILISISFLIISIINVSKLAKQTFIILIFSYFFEQTLLIINTILRATQKSKQYNINTTAVNLIKIIAILMLYYVIGYQSINVIALSILISEVLQYLILFKILNLKEYYKKELFDIKIIKEMFLYGFPLIGVAVTSWILNVSDRYVIKIFCSVSDVGLYSYAYSLGNSLFTLLTQFIMLGAYGNIVKAWENNGKEEANEVIKKYLKIYFLIIIPACVGATMIARDFFEIFTNERYQSSYNVFSITSIGIAILGVSQYTNKYWELKKNTNMLFKLNIFIAVLNIILNFIFVPICGYKIAAVTTMVSYLIYLIISLVLVKGNIKIDLKALFKIFLSALVMIFVIRLYNNISNLKNDFIFLVIKIILGGITYLIMVVITKAVDMKFMVLKLKEKYNKFVKERRK